MEILASTLKIIAHMRYMVYGLYRYIGHNSTHGILDTYRRLGLISNWRYHRQGSVSDISHDLIRGLNGGG